MWKTLKFKTVIFRECTFYLGVGGNVLNRTKLPLDFLYRNISNPVMKQFFELKKKNVKLKTTKMVIHWTTIYKIWI